MFGTIGRTGDDRMSGTGSDADRLAGHMMDAWIAFARHGDPSHNGIGTWPAYEPDTRPTMVFDRETAATTEPFPVETAMWADLMAGPAIAH